MVFQVLAVVVWSGECLGETEVISVHYRMAAEVLPMVKGMLSPEGTVTADVRTNSLVVTDTAARLEHVRAFLSVHDKPVRQVTIRVRFDSESSLKRRGVSAGGRISGKHGTVSKGNVRHDGVRIRGQYRNDAVNRDADYFVRTASGSPAYIRVATNIPWTRKWSSMGAVSHATEFTNVETGMEVVPVVMGGRVNLSIYPKLSYLDDMGGKTVVRCTEAGTQISVPFGVWTVIAGGDDRTDRAMSAILETAKSTRRDVRSISVMVDDG